MIMKNLSPFSSPFVCFLVLWTWTIWRVGGSTWVTSHCTTPRVTWCCWASSSVRSISWPKSWKSWRTVCSTHSEHWRMRRKRQTGSSLYLLDFYFWKKKKNCLQIGLSEAVTAGFTSLCGFVIVLRAASQNGAVCSSLWSKILGQLKNKLETRNTDDTAWLLAGLLDGYVETTTECQNLLFHSASNSSKLLSFLSWWRWRWSVLIVCHGNLAQLL